MAHTVGKRFNRIEDELFKNDIEDKSQEYTHIYTPPHQKKKKKRNYFMEGRPLVVQASAAR